MSFTTKQAYHVAIVGGGFSGAMVAVHLARLAPRLRVLVIDKGGAYGPGVAYGTVDREHLLNVPAGKISAFADEPTHFFDWLKKHRAELADIGVEGISADAFLPRKVYGQYVKDLFDQARATNDSIETIDTEIVDIDPGTGGRHESRGQGVGDRVRSAGGDNRVRDSGSCSGNGSQRAAGLAAGHRRDGGGDGVGTGYADG